MLLATAVGIEAAHTDATTFFKTLTRAVRDLWQKATLLGWLLSVLLLDIGLNRAALDI